MLLSRTAVSQLTDALWEEYEAFTERDLTGFDVLYLFVDAIYEPLRRAGFRERILCVWAIFQDGRKVLIHVVLGTTESYEVCLELFRDLIRRGLPIRLSVTSDGAPSLLRAIEEAFPQSLRIRCWAHKMRNVLDKVPESAREEGKAHLQAVRDAPTPEAGEQAAANVLERLAQEYPSAMRSFSTDLEASLAHLRVPIAHRKYVRTTNLIERGFVEERRRTKTIPYFTTEKSCLKLVFSILWRASERWQRVRITKLERRQLDILARALGLHPNPDGGPGKKAEECRERSRLAA